MFEEPQGGESFPWCPSRGQPAVASSVRAWQPSQRHEQLSVNDCSCGKKTYKYHG